MKTTPLIIIGCCVAVCIAVMFLQTPIWTKCLNLVGAIFCLVLFCRVLFDF